MLVFPVIKADTDIEIRFSCCSCSVKQNLRDQLWLWVYFPKYDATTQWEMVQSLISVPAISHHTQGWSLEPPFYSATFTNLLSAVPAAMLTEALP